MNKNKYTLLIIAIIVVVVIGIVIYVITSRGSGTVAVPTSGLAKAVSRDINGTPTTNTTGATPAEGLLQTLQNLKHIELNEAIFSRADFISLVDYTVELTDLPRGRNNPFAPLGAGEAFNVGGTPANVVATTSRNTSLPTPTPSSPTPRVGS